MMSPQKWLLILFCLGLMSAGVWAIHCLWERARIPAVARLRLLKATLIAFWIFPLACFLLKPEIVFLRLPQVEAAAKSFENTTPLGVTLQQHSLSIAEVTLWIYLSIVVILLAQLGHNYVLARKLLAKAKLSSWRGHLYRVSDAVSMPLAFGGNIYLPARHFSERQMQITLTHEAVHVANGDPHWKMFSLVTRAALFFAPPIYGLLRRLELDMEIECDRQSMTFTGATKQEYGSVLIDMAAAISLSPLFSYMSNNKQANNQLKRRISAMTTTAKSRPVLVLVLSMFMATVGFAAVALVSAPDSSRFYKVEAQIVVNETHVASPTIVSLAGEEAVIESGSANENFELKIWANEGQRNLGEVDLKMALKFRNSQISLETKNQYALALNQWSELPLSASGNPTVKLRLRVTEAP